MSKIKAPLSAGKLTQTDDFSTIVQDEGGEQLCIRGIRAEDGIFAKMDFVSCRFEHCRFYKCDFSQSCRERAKKLNPDIRIIPVSAKTGEGIEEWADWLRGQVYDWNRY